MIFEIALGACGILLLSSLYKKSCFPVDNISCP